MGFFLLLLFFGKKNNCSRHFFSLDGDEIHRVNLEERERESGVSFGGKTFLVKHIPRDIFAWQKKRKESKGPPKKKENAEKKASPPPPPLSRVP